VCSFTLIMDVTWIDLVGLIAFRVEEVVNIKDIFFLAIWWRYSPTSFLDCNSLQLEGTDALEDSLYKLYKSLQK
jgi:hypothetical protein